VDTNGNGVRDPGEGLPGVPVYITTANGPITVTTDANGVFTASVPAGLAVVDVDDASLPGGATQTVGDDPTVVNVPLGGTATDNNGYVLPTATPTPTNTPTATPTNTPTNTPTATNTPTNTPTPTPTPVPVGVTVRVTDTLTLLPIPGAVVTVTLPDGTKVSGVSDPNGYFTPTIPATVTLTPGQTVVVEASKPGYTPNTVTSQPLVAGPNTVLDPLTPVPLAQPGVYVSDPTGKPVAGLPITINTSTGQVITGTTDANGYFTPTVTLPVGTVFTPTATGPGNTTLVLPGSAPLPSGTTVVSGVVPLLEVNTFYDLNANGVKDEGEALSGVTVVITPSNGNAYSVTTDAQGWYTTIVPSGATGVDVINSSLPITLAHPSAQTVGTDPSVVNVPSGGIGRDENGYRHSTLTVIVTNTLTGEPLSNIPVTITLGSGLVITGTTNGNGQFTPTMPSGNPMPLPPGETVVVVVGPGIQLGPKVLEPGENVVSTGMEPVIPTRIVGVAWEDVNHNGQRDASEPVLNNVVVRLLNNAGAVISQTTTDAGGAYTFTRLVSGTYAVEFVKPAGYEATMANVGGDSADSDADEVSGRTPPIVVVGGATSRNNDAGYWRPASLGDRVWLDVNNNGLQDGGEPGVANVTVKLYSGGILISTTQTNGSGNYQFTNLVSGVYTVSFMLPGGYTFVTPNVGSDEGIDSDAEMTTGEAGPISIVSGGAEPRVDAGLYILPQLGLEKQVSVVGGGGAGTVVRPGDELVYTLIVKNDGSTVATNVVVTDPLESAVVQYVIGSAVPAVTRQVDNNLIWELGTVNPGEQKTITFRVKLASNLNDATVIKNVALISGRESSGIVTSRNSNVVDNPFEPNAVTLARFEATTVSGRGVKIKWVTTSEVETWSYALYRAEGSYSGDTIASSAEKINPEAILSEGRGGGGAVYEYADTSAQGGKVYTYWLVETETTGRTNVYGPAKWVGNGGPGKLYLPLLIRSVRR
jgi:uncharacterized repeat protein (TIGR01451 family)